MFKDFYMGAKSIYKNLRKGKFKALLRYFYDEKYQSDIDHMLSLVRGQEMELIDGKIRLGDIVNGHEINYPEWVIELRRRIRTEGSRSLDPVKVVWDSSKSKFLIVDGNHRFSALIKELGALVVVDVKILVPKQPYPKVEDYESF